VAIRFYQSDIVDRLRIPSELDKLLNSTMIVRMNGFAVRGVVTKNEKGQYIISFCTGQDSSCSDWAEVTFTADRVDTLEVKEPKEWVTAVRALVTLF
jgi:hypothetical protein